MGAKVVSTSFVINIVIVIAIHQYVIVSYLSSLFFTVAFPILIYDYQTIIIIIFIIITV